MLQRHHEMNGIPALPPLAGAPSRCTLPGGAEFALSFHSQRAPTRHDIVIMNAKDSKDRQTNRQTDRQAHKQTCKQANLHTSKQASKQTSKQTSKHTTKQPNNQITMQTTQTKNPNKQPKQTNNPNNPNNPNKQCQMEVCFCGTLEPNASAFGVRSSAWDKSEGREQVCAHATVSSLHTD